MKWGGSNGEEGGTVFANDQTSHSFLLFQRKKRKEVMPISKVSFFKLGGLGFDFNDRKLIVV